MSRPKKNETEKFTINYSLRLGRPLYVQLGSIAKKEGRTIGEILRELGEKYVEENNRIPDEDLWTYYSEDPIEDDDF